MTGAIRRGSEKIKIGHMSSLKDSIIKSLYYSITKSFY